jgi:hypothetical protein
MPPPSSATPPQFVPYTDVPTAQYGYNQQLIFATSDVYSSTSIKFFCKKCLSYNPRSHSYEKIGIMLMGGNAIMLRDDME